MRIAFGFKAHSGWAILVALGRDHDELVVVERARIELVDDRAATWAGQPYHAAEQLQQPQARTVVEHGIAHARRCAVRELRAAIRRANGGGHAVSACAVLMPAPMPAWSIEEILAVHLRMHKAEGVLYPDALARAADTCGLRFVGVGEKSLAEEVTAVTGLSATEADRVVARLGRTVGAPWAADHKRAALAAWVALAG